MSLVVRKAEKHDLLKIQRLMARAGAQDTAIDEQVTKFLVVENDEKAIIGIAGIEKGKKNGLIRSFILDSPTWTAEMSIEFMDIVLAYAKERKIERIYACTKGKTPLFWQLGFRQIDKEEVPIDVSSLPHYQRTIGQNVAVWSYDLKSKIS
ncbi:hypothetical protein AJ85_19490 [Alkalihalobacillus alcalophilus ATCC 27647 = CGMCC 1.3604]|uniref:N-acetyltransferase domain-containing protein n=2 Tax=Alkalihalobacillus alcalophilus TaxID=1445 RepID=A0A4S4JVG0_ALKAL|nr:hypothetical protein [Alkalihalobacillus alcalophilus]MED1561126.1 hypothetical protein [Alkalihalobacillus alcalophilus]THG89118.1 hypothetical protein AJ85_19490 [Alkalihalobacillus alcalophilus ATCC 27647 = CGMCC 1.3604]